jgi:hypothetical protein
MTNDSGDWFFSFFKNFTILSSFTFGTLEVCVCSFTAHTDSIPRFYNALMIKQEVTALSTIFATMRIAKTRTPPGVIMTENEKGVKMEESCFHLSELTS